MVRMGVANNDNNNEKRQHLGCYLVFLVWMVGANYNVVELIQLFNNIEEWETQERCYRKAIIWKQNI